MFSRSHIFVLVYSLYFDTFCILFLFVELIFTQAYSNVVGELSVQYWSCTFVLKTCALLYNWTLLTVRLRTFTHPNHQTFRQQKHLYLLLIQLYILSIHNFHCCHHSAIYCSHVYIIHINNFARAHQFVAQANNAAKPKYQASKKYKYSPSLNHLVCCK